MYRKLPALHVYVSDAKIDEYYEQIPRGFLSQVLSGGFAIGAGGLKLSLPSLIVPSNKYRKLDVVLAHLHATGQVGSAMRPNFYFEDTLPLRFGVLQRMGEMACYSYIHEGPSRSARGDEGEHPPVATVVVLVGSAYHLVDSSFRRAKNIRDHAQVAAAYEDTEEDAGFSRDVTAIAKAIREEVVVREYVDISQTLIRQFKSRAPDENVSDARTYVALAAQLPNRQLRYNFFAIRLFSKTLWHELYPGEGVVKLNVVLGTPFFVALAE